MVNGKAPVYATMIAAAVFIAVLLLFQPYTAAWPGHGYTRPAQRYLRAALRQDSLGLARQSASGRPVVWALEAARRHPESLELWARYAQAWTSAPRGDTVDVYVYASTRGGCGEAPLVLRYVGSGDHRKVLEAGSACFNAR